MCSLFSPRMEKDQGDLADIVRASGGGGGSSTGSSDQTNWPLPSGAGNFSSARIEEPIDNFGDPFSNMHDPLLHELDLESPGFFDRSNSTGLVKMNMEEDINLTNTTTSHLPLRPRTTTTIFNEDMRRPTNNIFSRMLQISPNSKINTSSTSSSPCDMISTVMASPRVATKNSSSPSHETIKNTGCSMDSVGMMQISSSQRNPGIKRRKSQAKKVVCIPAPAAANSSRPSGEVVPSDLWAWRKYGQKPIKGSPYPRGYYRCSSSKGCSARKQVERSRTDPNMLVITYTSEHNHPWPTQRNALAGSTRSQPPKGNAAPSKSSTSPQASSKLMNMKEEHIEHVTESMSISIVDGSINVSPSSVKEETADMNEKPVENNLDDFRHQSYRPPTSFDSNLHPDDFFADLGELAYDPLNLLFTQGFNGEKFEEGRETKQTVDPFSLFDWAGNNNMFGENKRA